MGNKIEQEYKEKQEAVRLNKYLSEAGVCSRREADRLIESGRVTVDGKRAETGMKVIPGQVVRVGKKVATAASSLFLRFILLPPKNSVYLIVTDLLQ